MHITIKPGMQVLGLARTLEEASSITINSKINNHHLKTHPSASQLHTYLVPVATNDFISGYNYEQY